MLKSIIVLNNQFLRFNLETSTCLISISLKNCLILLLMGVSLFQLQGCSSKSNAPLNKVFHNTTSRYNAYFIGLEKIQAVEASILKALKPDYNNILHIYPPLDSTMATTYASELEDCIKKASIVIQYHENSKWVDDSYNLIGQARMYGYDFPNAITTFKYVNTKGTDPDAKHWAIVNLMRTFIENFELANAEEASDYLESEILNKQNLKHLYLTRAYYYQVIDDKDKMVRNLVRADPLLSRTERARYYFIIGQVYQEIGFSSAAYEYYKKCIASNPSYELSFYAKLNIAQVTELGDSRDLKKVRKYFKKLVKDEKNVEFQDRIYFEWGTFELKQTNLSLAIEKFELSVQTSLTDPRQKGVSYVSLGKIYYDTLKNYPVAEAYYDSAVNVLPTDYEYYKSVKHRQEVLTDFITQINTINLQDSLLNFSEMDSSTVMNIFIAKATADEDLKEREAKIEENKASQSQASFNFGDPTGVGKSNWYFSNPSSIGGGRTSFRQVWGLRTLEDHWRRSVKFAVTSNEENLDDIDQEGQDEETKEVLTKDQVIISSALAMYSQLPLTEVTKAEAHKKLEAAYYSLGKLYYFDLEEDENAGNAFRTLLSNYPESEDVAEVNYLLYLIYKDQEKEELAEGIVAFMHKNMPNSLYTKIIDNPDYEELSDQANEILSKEYKHLYALYLNNELDSASKAIEELLRTYPDVKFTANLRLLQILIIGKTEPLADYQLALQSYIDEYPDHELTSYANELLESSKTYLDNLVKLKAAEFFDSKTDVFFYVVLSSPDSTSANEIILQPIIDINFSKANLDVGSLTLSDSLSMTIVKQFSSKEDVLLFFDTVKAEQVFKDPTNVSIVISESNFDILYKSKEIEAYMEFYREHF